MISLRQISNSLGRSAGAGCNKNPGDIWRRELTQLCLSSQFPFAVRWPSRCSLRPADASSVVPVPSAPRTALAASKHDVVSAAWPCLPMFSRGPPRCHVLKIAAAVARDGRVGARRPPPPLRRHNSALKKNLPGLVLRASQRTVAA